MAEKTIQEWITEMKVAFGDGIHSMQVLDAHGNVFKQTDNWVDQEIFLKAERLRNQGIGKSERFGDGYKFK